MPSCGGFERGCTKVNHPCRSRYQGFTKALIAALAVLAAVVVAACDGQPPESSESSQVEPPLITEVPAGYNAADVDFANNVIVILKQYQEIAALAPSRANSAELIALASSSGAGAQVEMLAAQALSIQWAENPDTKVGGAEPQKPSDGGLADPATVAHLGALSGPEFDGIWLQTAKGLLSAAVDLASTEITRGKNVDAVGLAKQIVAAHQSDLGALSGLG